MNIGAFITITRPEERGDIYAQCVQSAKGFADVVCVVDGSETWPQEFDWPLIGQHFQKGYEDTDADWVFHLDTDFIFHERDYWDIRQACIENNDAPALSFYKHQFILPDRYNLKSRLVIAVNKSKYGDRIRFDSGGDLCQPSLDGVELKPDDVPEAGIPFFNYEKPIKTEAQVKDDVGRMARAWQRHFGEYKLGGPDDDSAYEKWLEMQVGRFNKPQKQIPITAHPMIMQDTIKNLQPDQWGFNGFGYLPGGYFKHISVRETAMLVRRDNREGYKSIGEDYGVSPARARAIVLKTRAKLAKLRGSRDA